MTEFKKTQILDAKSAKNLTPDNIYWKRLNFPVTTKQYGFINGLEFSPAEPYRFSVAYSTKIDVYDPHTHKPCASLTKFKKCAYGGSFRQDGQLLVAGGEDGRVKLFTVDSKLMLRLFKGHESAVHCAKFLFESQRIASFSDDRTIKTWNIATEAQLMSLTGHTDYVRCGSVAHRSADVLISGSYDHTVRLWDLRQPGAKSIFTVEHGSPVEAVLFFPNDSLVVSAGGINLRIWDIASGGRLLCQMSNHRKTISSISLCTDNRRLLSASLDRHVKVYDLVDYRVVHTMVYPAPIVKLGISKDDQVLAVAMTDGLLSVQHRQPEKQLNSKPKCSKFMSQQYVIGRGSYDSPADVTVVEEHKTRLAQYDIYMRTFQYKKALDCVLKNPYFLKHPEVVASLFKEFIRRKALEKALHDRPDQDLYPVLKYVIKNFGKVQYSSLMMDVTNVLFDHYGPLLDGMDPRTVELFRRLRSVVDHKATELRLVASLMGALELVLNSAAAPAPAGVSHKLDISVENGINDLESNGVNDSTVPLSGADVLTSLLTGQGQAAANKTNAHECSRKRKIER